MEAKRIGLIEKTIRDMIGLSTLEEVVEKLEGERIFISKEDLQIRISKMIW